MTDAAQIRRCSGALRANLLVPQTPNLRISNRESLRLGTHQAYTNQSINHTRRDFITPSSRFSGEKSKKAPSKNVSVRKKSAECFQRLTRILIDTMFRLELISDREEERRISVSKMEGHPLPAVGRVDKALEPDYVTAPMAIELFLRSC
jgi:hypothetical protein